MSLIEVILSLSLVSMVLMAGMDVLSMAVGQQVVEARQTRVQSDAFLGWRAAEVELRESTEIFVPAGVGGTSDSLSGCRNHDSRLGAGAAGALDPSQPVTSFLFCASGGSLHFYQTAGCPTTVICGAAGGLVVANGVSHLPPAATYFSIPAPGLVRVVYQTSAQSQAQAKAQTQAVDVEVAFNRAAGTNQ
jgi:hypothetical protein